MKTAAVLISLLFSTAVLSQLKIGGLKGIDKGTKNSKETPTKESPAQSDIRMADMYSKELNTMLEDGDFKVYGKLETKIPSKIKDLKERVETIEEVDPKYDTENYHNDLAKFEKAYNDGISMHNEKTANDRIRKDSIASANSPENTLLRDIESWAHYISFSKTPITAETEVRKDGNFISGDMIYGRAYFKKDVSEIFNSDKYLTSYEVNGKEIYRDDMGFKTESGSKYVDIVIVVPDKRRVNRLKAFNELPVGNHEITVKFGNDLDMRTKIIGTFNLNVSESGKTEWVKIINAYEMRRISENEAPAEGFKNSTICSDAIRIYKEKDYNGDPYKAYIDTDEWMIKRNTVGTILSRSVDVVVWIKVNSEVCEYSILRLRQDYNGSSYGKSYFSGIGTTEKVLCSKIK